MALFNPCVINVPFDGTVYNANMVEAENSFHDLGPFVISGLTITAGTGLTVNVALGTASIGGRVTAAAFTITGLTDNTTNHLWILNTGAGTSNTTGTAPANSAKLGTCVTAGGVVISVNMGRSSGRQQFVQPQNIVHGGLAVGVTSAGHPRSVLLSNWASTPGEGVEVAGTLPSGAADLSAAVILAPNSPTRNTIQPTADANPCLVLKPHSAAQSAGFLNVLGSDNVIHTSIRRDGTLKVEDTGDGVLIDNTLFAVYKDGTRFVDVDALGNLNVEQGGFNVIGPSSSYPGILLYARLGPGEGTAGDTFITCHEDGFKEIFSLGPTAIQKSSGLSSTATSRQVTQFTPSFASNTDASWKGRGVWSAVDSAGTRECLRFEADGAAARIGVYGHAAVARPAAYTVTNPTSNRSFDETAVTLTQLAQVVGTLVSDLQSIGWLG